MPTTIKDVAEKAGVSITTVSHVINKTRFVSEELIKRVEAAIEELHYQPNPLGRGLRKGQTYAIAVLLPDPGNPFFQMVARGIEEQTYQHNFTITCFNTDEDPEREESCLSLLRGRGLDGFIVAPTTKGNENLRSLIEEGIPLVLIDRYNSRLAVDQVYSANRKGGYIATEHLVSLGHDRIGVLVGIRGLRTIEDRLEGYRSALRDKAIDIDESLIMSAYSKIEEGFSATRQLLGEHPEVSAIFSTNNMMTLGALKYFKQAGIRCPQDVSLIGFDDSEWASISTPALTVVAQQPYEMGYRAGELLFETINGQRKRKRARKIKLETNLIIRESTATSTRISRLRR